MTDAVLGIDIGTSSVKVIAVNRHGKVLQSASESLDIIQPQNGFNEQHPEAWFEATKRCIKRLMVTDEVKHMHISGLSLSGQMHSLVILDDNGEPLRNAILWNDTRTTPQCEVIREKLGDYVLDNPVLEGFTLTKLLWIKENEPEHWRNTKVFLLPKDYVRFKLTGKLNMEYSDASSTLLFDHKCKAWDENIGKQFGIHNIYPKLVASHKLVGYMDEEIATELGLNAQVAVIAGGGDNACGALGAGMIKTNETLCSIGTSGVVLSCESEKHTEYRRNMHYFNHALEDMAYVMGVTLAAGDSLQWLRRNILGHLSYDEIITMASQSQVGSNGLLFTPYLSGERTPHGDSNIRGSFIGLSGLHSSGDMARAVIEGITFSLFESIKYLRDCGKDIQHVVSIGGGAKSDFWLQLQADIFNAEISKLKYEEGPCMGAAILAVYGLGWYESIEAATKQFIRYEKSFKPDSEKHKQYMEYFALYQSVYRQTQSLTASLLEISKSKK
ncbi:MAG: xylulokinase [Staphylococcus equorum]